MKCVSASRTSAETELAIFFRKKDGVIVLTLNCTRFGQYVMTLDGLGNAHCQSTAMHEQARAEQEKGVFRISF